MNASINAFILVCAGVLTIVSVVAGATAAAASILYRSVLLDKEVAVRRMLGARRSQIVRMLLAENVIGIAVGVLGAGAVVNFVDGFILSAAIVTTTAVCGGWLAARHAVRRTDPDRRGHL